MYDVFLLYKKPTGNTSEGEVFISLFTKYLFKIDQDVI